MTIDRALYLISVRYRLLRNAIGDDSAGRLDAWLKSLKGEDRRFMARINKADAVCFFYSEDNKNPVPKFTDFLRMLNFEADPKTTEPNPYAPALKSK